MSKPDDTEYYDGPITQAPKSKGAESKKCSMQTHFNYFVFHHWNKRDDNNCPLFNKLTQEHVTVNLVDNFVNYLSSIARKFCKPDSPLLVYGSIDQYLSSFKNNLIKKFFDDDSNKRLVINDEGKMSLLRRTMLQIKMTQCRKDGISVMKSLETASEEDIDAFFQLCFWQGTDESAE